ncbi:MAG TPA: hypothetical protein VKY92_15005 [Verrucomicrobiae bacterium]|nr:hypothetical protein [Verrucomicrobiae bacterium]
MGEQADHTFPGIDLNALKKEGLYLFFENGRFMDFSKERIKQLADEYWRSPDKLPEAVRRDENFKTCNVCPYRGQDVMCSAMKPLLPFLEELDAFMSFNQVLAVCVSKDGMLYASRTTLQRALQYISNMALFEYCEDAKQYRAYFKGIHPFMEMDEAVAVTFLNLYWLYAGDRGKIAARLNQIGDAVKVTSVSCINRLRTMCHSDAFINSYIITHTFADAFSSIEEIMDQYYNGKPTRAAAN